ncbi:hypothetical protein KJZ99_06400 [bacterium]|nr:hypothetical protein [bacterium]
MVAFAGQETHNGGEGLLCVEQDVAGGGGGVDSDDEAAMSGAARRNIGGGGGAADFAGAVAFDFLSDGGCCAGIEEARDAGDLHGAELRNGGAADEGFRDGNDFANQARSGGAHSNFVMVGHRGGGEIGVQIAPREVFVGGGVYFEGEQEIGSCTVIVDAERSGHNESGVGGVRCEDGCQRDPSGRDGLQDDDASQLRQDCKRESREC